MEVLLPLLGDVMTEGTITPWFQPDGAEVREGEPLYQLETDKVNLTVDAPRAARSSAWWPRARPCRSAPSSRRW